MKQKIHFIAGILATLTIATFYTSTIIVELFGTQEAVATVKSLILFPGLFFLVPAIAVTGGTGFVLSKSRTGSLVQVKQKRMPFIGANGLLILIPCAIFLDSWASSSRFDIMFYIVQGYRESFIYFSPFWRHPYQTLYFFFFVFVIFIIGALIFKKLTRILVFLVEITRKAFENY